MATIFRAPLIFRTWHKQPWAVAVGSQSWVWQEGQTLRLVGKDTFFRTSGYAPNYDYPNPTLPISRWVAVNTQMDFRPDRILDLLKGKDTFFRGAGDAPNYDWPNPILPKDRRVAVNTRTDVAADRLLTLLKGQDIIWAGQGQVPDYDWPNPVRPKDSRVAVSGQSWVWEERNTGLLKGRDTIWADQGQVPDYDWTNPVLPKDRRVAVQSQTGVLQNILVGPLYVFTFNYIIGPPLIFRNWAKDSSAAVRSQNEVWQNRTSALLPPFFQTEWPNPGARGRSGPFEAPNLLTSTLQVYPFSNFNWPNPRGAAQAFQPIVIPPNLSLFLQASSPFANFVWRNPLVRRSHVVAISSVSDNNVSLLPLHSDVVPVTGGDNGGMLRFGVTNT